LEFASANRPMYIFHNNELTEIKGDKNPIGGAQYDNKTYTLHTIPIEPQTTIYLFTDGITDQFGGPNGRKYTPKQLQAKLLSIQSMTMEQQSKFLHEDFDGWKEKTRQIDDMTLMAVKLG